jgi:hypothetical protein
MATDFMNLINHHMFPQFCKIPHTNLVKSSKRNQVSTFKKRDKLKLKV